MPPVAFSPDGLRAVENPMLCRSDGEGGDAAAGCSGLRGLAAVAPASITGWPPPSTARADAAAAIAISASPLNLGVSNAHVVCQHISAAPKVGHLFGGEGAGEGGGIHAAPAGHPAKEVWGHAARLAGLESLHILRRGGHAVGLVRQLAAAVARGRGAGGRAWFGGGRQAESGGGRASEGGQWRRAASDTEECTATL